MIDESKNRLLMSDSLKGMVPELEDDATQTAAGIANSFVIAVLEMRSAELIAGSLDGISIEDNSIKVDVKVNIDNAYDLMIMMSNGARPVCEAIQLHKGDKMHRIPGPYEMTTPKMFGIDPPSKLCVLAVDLIRI